MWEVVALVAGRQDATNQARRRHVQTFWQPDFGHDSLEKEILNLNGK